MLLTRYGRREWLALTVVLMPAAIAAFLAGFRAPSAWFAAGVILLVWLAGIAFFRDPLGRRPATTRPRDLVSPADGRVSAVLTVDHHDAVNGPAVIVRIFLSVLDVHLNRSPCDGTVERLESKPGQYLDARTEESARVNESNLIVLRAPWGDPIGVRQVSGAIARRIVCPLKLGDSLRRGARFGMIKFGSTTELIVGDPACVTVHVSKGARVTGGVTILASVADPEAPPHPPR